MTAFLLMDGRSNGLTARNGFEGGTMNYDMTTPCDACPFLKTPNMKRGFSLRRLKEFASGEFPCHKTASNDEETGDFIATKDSQHCAGALIYLEKRGIPHQMMRICSRIGLYDPSKLNMEANVR